MKCEVCGSENIVKQDGVFVCQSCGAKYSLEEVKKLVANTGGDVVDNVSTQDTKKLDNLYILARRAKDSDDAENAQKYYEMISLEDPSSWEAYFYSIYYRSMRCKIKDIAVALNDVSKSFKSTLELIKNQVNPEGQPAAIKEVADKVIEISTNLQRAEKDFFDGLGSSIKRDYLNEMSIICVGAALTPKEYGDLVKDEFEETEEIGRIITHCYKACINLYAYIKLYYSTADAIKERFDPMLEFIRKYEPEYDTPTSQKSSGGCYVATCVYGSYDCPEVWALRRFRDYDLAKTWYGRLFIRTYYTVSPTLVKLFGNTAWFKNMWKPKLDKMVKDLVNAGYSTEPYEDKTY